MGLDGLDLTLCLEIENDRPIYPEFRDVDQDQFVDEDIGENAGGLAVAA